MKFDADSAMIGYALGLLVAVIIVLSTYDFKRKGR